MATIAQVHKNFKKFDVFGTAMDVLIQSEKQVVAVTRKQLTKGRRKTGKKIGNTRNRRYKSARYARYKNKKNPQAGEGNPDLILEGGFSKELRIQRASRMEYNMDSTDEKAQMLEGKYGTTIYGMSDTNAGIFVKTKYEGKYINRARRLLKL